MQPTNIIYIISILTIICIIGYTLVYYFVPTFNLFLKKNLYEGLEEDAGLNDYERLKQLHSKIVSAKQANESAIDQFRKTVSKSFSNVNLTDTNYRATTGAPSSEFIIKSAKGRQPTSGVLTVPTRKSIGAATPMAPLSDIPVISNIQSPPEKPIIPSISKPVQPTFITATKTVSNIKQTEIDRPDISNINIGDLLQLTTFARDKRELGNIMFKPAPIYMDTPTYNPEPNVTTLLDNPALSTPNYNIITNDYFSKLIASSSCSGSSYTNTMGNLCLDIKAKQLLSTRGGNVYQTDSEIG